MPDQFLQKLTAKYTLHATSPTYARALIAAGNALSNNAGISTYHVAVDCLVDVLHDLFNIDKDQIRVDIKDTR